MNFRVTKLKRSHVVCGLFEIFSTDQDAKFKLKIVVQSHLVNSYEPANLGVVIVDI